MTDIYRDVIRDPAAWTPATLGGKAAITRTLTKEEIDALRQAIDGSGDRSPQAATREDFSAPAIAALAEDIRGRVMDGKCLTVVAGLDPAEFGPEALERVFWGLGLHFGVPAVQSRSGDMLGRVEQDASDPVQRGYRGQTELSMHTDSYEFVGLHCIRRAASGGESALSSALSIHNEIFRQRPDLLDPLYQGYYMAIPEARESAQPVTAQKVPVFCNVNGTVSCMYAGSFYRYAAEMRGEALPEAFAEALELFASLANSDDLALRTLLEPGEMVLWHNFVNLHSRTAFENDEEHRRLLLRLWLDVPQGRPVIPEFHIRADTYKRVYEQHRDEERA